MAAFPVPVVPSVVVAMKVVGWPDVGIRVQSSPRTRWAGRLSSSQLLNAYVGVSEGGAGEERGVPNHSSLGFIPSFPLRAYHPGLPQRYRRHSDTENPDTRRPGADRAASWIGCRGTCRSFKLESVTEDKVGKRATPRTHGGSETQIQRPRPTLLGEPFVKPNVASSPISQDV